MDYNMSHVCTYAHIYCILCMCISHWLEIVHLDSVTLNEQKISKNNWQNPGILEPSLTIALFAGAKLDHCSVWVVGCVLDDLLSCETTVTLIYYSMPQVHYWTCSGWSHVFPWAVGVGSPPSCAAHLDSANTFLYTSIFFPCPNAVRNNSVKQDIPGHFVILWYLNR